MADKISFNAFILESDLAILMIKSLDLPGLKPGLLISKL